MYPEDESACIEGGTDASFIDGFNASFFVDVGSGVDCTLFSGEEGAEVVDSEMLINPREI
jgi:hypothetical protein